MTFSQLQLRCIVCREPFDFGRETAVVLRHVAYGYDFVHSRHESTALDWIFVDPQYDRPEFSRDDRRARILAVAPADNCAAVMPARPDQIATGDLFSVQPLGLWALVESRDGSRYVEGLVREPEWDTEPGGALFPEGSGGARDAVGYTRMSQPLERDQVACWQAAIYARNRGDCVPVCQPANSQPMHPKSESHLTTFGACAARAVPETEQHGSINTAPRSSLDEAFAGGD